MALVMLMLAGVSVAVVVRAVRAVRAVRPAPVPSPKWESIQAATARQDWPTVERQLVPWLINHPDDGKALVRPVIDFAHLHAVTDGGFTDTSKFQEILEGSSTDTIQLPIAGLQAREKRRCGNSPYPSKIGSLTRCPLRQTA